MPVLDTLDMTAKLSKDEESDRLDAAQKRLLELRLDMAGLTRDDGRLGPPLCILFEGFDASGKGGAIKRLVASGHSRSRACSSTPTISTPRGTSWRRTRSATRA